jgi:hypothetical protein
MVQLKVMLRDMSTFTRDHILYALFTLSRRGAAIDAGVLGRFAGTSALVAAEALVALERDQLADASRMRLTLQGLAQATRLHVDAADSGWPLPPSAAEPAMPARPAPRVLTPRRAREPAVVMVSPGAVRGGTSAGPQH